MKFDRLSESTVWELGQAPKYVMFAQRWSMQTNRKLHLDTNPDRNVIPKGTIV